MFNTKADVVRHLSFTRDIYNRIKYYGFYRNAEEFDICGVIFAGQWAFVTNGHFFIRIRIPDRQPNQLIQWNLKNEVITQGEEVLDQLTPKNQGPAGQTHLFWRYNEGKWDSITFKHPEIINIEMFHSYFFNWADNIVAFNKDEFIEKMDGIFKNSSSDKMKRFVRIQPDPAAGLLRFKIFNVVKEKEKVTSKPKKEEREKEFAIKLILPDKVVVSPCVVVGEPILLSCFYIYELMAAFENQTTFVSMHYNPMPHPTSDDIAPVTFKMYDPDTGRIDGDISIAIGNMRSTYEVDG